MAPIQCIELILIRMHYKEIIGSVKTTYVKTQGRGVLYEQSWFNYVIRHKVSRDYTEENTIFWEWEIEHSTRVPFTFMDDLFPHINVVISESQMFWMFYGNQKQCQWVTNNEVMKTPFCSCCINEQFERLVKLAKDQICN